ncbi:interferon gamma receptor 1 [Pempheris klunzingeri]|uniref:interferon gamma receptor 1 n=1 Tax=Pempheris klunzingeri TaxID=3127111 RepID=UPI003980DC90
MLPHGAFKALLLLVCGASAATVLPPTNVTVSCQTPKVTVSWLHGGQQPHTFRVRVQSSAGDYVEDITAAHQYDLSRFVWASETRYMDLHFVNMTAIQGDEQSAWVESDTFSFNQCKTAALKFKLDFPPVELNEAVVHFRNPFKFYRELKQATKQATFRFTVSVGAVGCSAFNGFCSVNQENCELNVSFPDGAERCFNLSGGLYDSNGVGEMMFRDTGRICPTKDTEDHVVVLIVLLSIIVIIIIGAVISVCWTKAWTLENQIKPVISVRRPTEKTNKAVDGHVAEVTKKLYFDVVETDISPVAVIKPCKRPSISSEDSAESSSPDLETVGLIREEYGTDADSVDDSEKTEYIVMDSEEEEEEEEEEESPYDCPQNLQVDMGDGDMVTGYTKR